MDRRAKRSAAHLICCKTPTARRGRRPERYHRTGFLTETTCSILGTKRIVLAKRHKAKRDADETRFSEIVDAIVDELHPHQRPKEDVQKVVRRSLELLLLEVDQLQRRLAGPRVAAMKHLRKVRETAAKLEILLLTMPTRVSWVREMSPGLLGTEDATGLLDPAPIERPNLKSMNFVLDLGRLQTSAKIAESYCGPSPLYEGGKHLSAKHAHLLITALSNNPPTNAPSGPLRTIASLIFEVLTGAKEANLERHCKAVLHRSKPQFQMKR